MELKLLLLALLLPALALAQQDNSIQSQMVLNITQPGTVNIADRIGNKVTITVIPDTEGPVKVDAMKAAQDALAALQPIMADLLSHFPTCAGQTYWCVPMKAAQPKVDGAKAKLDALYPPPPPSGAGQ